MPHQGPPHQEPSWSLDQLAGQVRAALSVDYPGQASGRVRDLPDGRAIRYYTTIGLVDRPLATHRRGARYGRRHLLQLVAVKRLQAAGRSLAAIQAELAGATDRQLEAVARVPAAVAPTPASPEPPPRPRFWAAQAGDGAPLVSAAAPAVATEATQDGTAWTVPAVRLGPGAALLLDRAGRPLRPDDLDAIAAAARPLLAVLRRRGLDRPDVAEGDSP